MEKTNVIFLDIDGVLNSERLYQLCSFYTWDLFDSESVRLLNRLVKQYNAFLVISSDWRKTYGIYKVKEVFKKNKIEGLIIGGIDKKKNKDEGIKKYLKSLSSKLIINYIVLDDEQLNIPNLIQTNPKYGFTFNEYQKANKILKQ